MPARYEKRLHDEDLWLVCEVKTGCVVLIAGHPYDGMAENEAAEIVALLNAGMLDIDPAPPSAEAD